MLFRSVSGWPGAQIWFDTAYAAVVCLLLAGLCWLAFHNRVRLRVALPALLLPAGLAVFTGNALSRDVVRVELVGSRTDPEVVISRNGSAVIPVSYTHLDVYKRQPTAP